MNVFRSYWEMLADFRPAAVGCIVLLGLSGVLEGVALLALIPVLNKNLPGAQGADLGPLAFVYDSLHLSDKGFLLAALGTFAVLGIGAALARLGSEASVMSLRTRVEEMARNRMGQALLHIDWSHFLALRMGDISKSFIAEGNQMGIGAQHFLYGLGSGLAALVYFLTALAISLEMTLYTLGFGLAGLVLFKLITRGARKHADALSRSTSSIGEQVGDIFDSLKFFRATGRSEAAASRASRVYRFYARSLYFSHLFGKLMRFGLEGGGIVFISIFLLATVMAQGRSIAGALVFLAVFYRLAPRLLAFQDSVFLSQIELSWYRTWKSRLEYATSHPARPFGTAAPVFGGAVEFKDVSFAYSGSKRLVLDKVNLAIGKGSCVAVVGPSGSGKSTLVDLATGLLAPDSGQVAVDGRDLRELDIDAWRKRLGLVLQESPVMHATVLENIAWGADEPDPARAEESARLAHAWEFIENLPGGLNAVVGEKGGRLSGGQRQRLALARSLYRRPWLLILDEATSALDGEAEAVVQKALEQAKRSCSILMVAHRLKTVHMADVIVVLEQGVIVETGTFSELMAKPGGHFRRMAELQGIQAGSLEA